MTQKEKAEREKHEDVEKNQAQLPSTQSPLQPTTPSGPAHAPYLATSVSKPRGSRGRPRKEPQPPSADDKPLNASKEELMRWQKKFNTRKWRYEKLTSDEAQEYRDAENARVKRARDAERQEIINVAQGQSQVYEHIQDTPRTVAHEKRIR